MLNYDGKMFRVCYLNEDKKRFTAEFAGFPGQPLTNQPLPDLPDVERHETAKIMD